MKQSPLINRHGSWNSNGSSSKHEIPTFAETVSSRQVKFETISNNQNSKFSAKGMSEFRKFENLCLFRISILGFRILPVRCFKMQEIMGSEYGNL